MHVLRRVNSIMDQMMYSWLQIHYSTAKNPPCRRYKKSWGFVCVHRIRNCTIFRLTQCLKKTKQKERRQFWSQAYENNTLLYCLGKTQNEFLTTEVNSEGSLLSKKRELCSSIHFSSGFPALCQPLHRVTLPQRKAQRSWNKSKSEAGEKDQIIFFSKFVNCIYIVTHL